MFYETTCSEKFLAVAGEKAQCTYYSYCNVLPMSNIIRQRTILFYKIIFRSDNVVLPLLSTLKRNYVGGLLSKYNIPGFRILCD